MDQRYYAERALTIARHPSGTDERMMVRCLAFALHASDSLALGKGLSDADDPDFSERDLTGAIRLWIEVGQPDERSILKWFPRLLKFETIIGKVVKPDELRPSAICGTVEDDHIGFHAGVRQEAASWQ